MILDYLAHEGFVQATFIVTVGVIVIVRMAIRASKNAN